MQVKNGENICIFICMLSYVYALLFSIDGLSMLKYCVLLGGLRPVEALHQEVISQQVPSRGDEWQQVISLRRTCPLRP